MTSLPPPALLAAQAVNELLIIDFVGLLTDDATKQLRLGTDDTAAAVGGLNVTPPGHPAFGDAALRAAYRAVLNQRFISADGS